MNIFIKRALAFDLRRFNSAAANPNFCVKFLRLSRLSKSSRLSMLYSTVKRNITFFIAAIVLSSLSACTLVVGEGSDDLIASSLTASPDSASPDSASPDSASPETASPDSASPDSASPETASPDSASPDSASPDSASPETASPETASPETTSPETTSPDTASSETTSPDTASPETTSPETASPESTSPESTSPETTSPETTSPESTSPETTSPETTPPYLPAPPVPIVTTVAHGAYSIELLWKRVWMGRHAYYEVYDSSGLVTTVSYRGNSYIASGLLPTTEYTYRVRVCDSSSCSDFVSISATTRDIRTINNATELAAIGDNQTTLADDYVLTTNIDLSAIPNWRPIGESLYDPFTGSFEGNGYNISGVTVSDYEFGGLFGDVDGASISNLGVVIGDISSATYAGGIAGRIGGGSRISNSSAVIMGNVHAFAHSGGLVGSASGSPISNSYAVVAGNISSDGTSGGLAGAVGVLGGSPISNSHAIVEGDISSAFASGGLAGTADHSRIINSYALVTGNIYSSSHSGGLVARSYKSPISRSYAVVGGAIYSTAPNVDGAYAYAGGLAGYAGSNNPISNSYAIVGGDISSSSFLYSYAAGLIGYVGTNTPISSSYALVEGTISSTSAVPAEAYTGGLTARDVSNNLFNKCYYSASRESSQGGDNIGGGNIEGFNNIYGVYKKVDELRSLNAATSNWDESIWDFGTDADLPTLFHLPPL